MTLTLTITDKGQVTLKRQALDHIDARPGDKVDVDLLPGGRIEVRKRPGKPIASIIGLLHDPDRPPLSIEDINRIVADGWAGKIK